MRQNAAEVEREDQQDCDATDTIQLWNDSQFSLGLPGQERPPLLCAGVIASPKIAETGSQ